MSFNYIDAFNSSSQVEYNSKQHDNAVELQGRRTYIFKLDKELTDKSNIYNEAVHGRLYLPHFEQRALYNTNEWQGTINLNNYIETEDVLTFEYNFARMVCNIRDLKDKISGNLHMKNVSDENIMAEINNGRFILKTMNDVNLLDLDLSKYKSVQLFINDVMKKCSLIKMTMEGDTEAASNIKAFSTRLRPNRDFKVEIKDRTYENCTDVIEMGDLILTDKYKLYQVQGVYPSGNMVNEYTSWLAKCNTVDLAMANLPDDYRRIVERNRYGLPKVDKE